MTRFLHHFSSFRNLFFLNTFYLICVWFLLLITDVSAWSWVTTKTTRELQQLASSPVHVRGEGGQKGGGGRKPKQHKIKKRDLAETATRWTTPPPHLLSKRDLPAPLSFLATLNPQKMPENCCNWAPYCSVRMMEVGTWQCSEIPQNSGKSMKVATHSRQRGSPIPEWQRGGGVGLPQVDKFSFALNWVFFLFLC